MGEDAVVAVAVVAAAAARYLRGALEVGDGLLVHLVLHKVGAEPRDHVHVDGEVAVRLLVVVERVRLVLLLQVDVADPREDAGVGGHARVEDLEPLHRGARLAGVVPQVGNVPDHLDRRRDDLVQLLEEPERRRVVAEPLRDDAQVVDRLDAVGLGAH